MGQEGIDYSFKHEDGKDTLVLCDSISSHRAVAGKDFDFKKPRAGLSAQEFIPHNHAHAEYEVYDYPGEYSESSDGATYARTRIEEIQSQHELAIGQGNANGLATGALFKLTHYARSDQNREYIIICANYEIGPLDYESTGRSYARHHTPLIQAQSQSPAMIKPNAYNDIVGVDS